MHIGQESKSKSKSKEIEMNIARFALNARKCICDYNNIEGTDGFKIRCLS